MERLELVGRNPALPASYRLKSDLSRIAGRTASTTLSRKLSRRSPTVLFGLLGAAFAPFVGADDTGRGAVLTLATALVVRPAVAAVCLLRSGLRRVEWVLVAWGGLKGAVPLLLAAYPALERLEGAERAQAIVLVATAASILVEGATLALIAGLAAPQQAASRGPG